MAHFLPVCRAEDLPPGEIRAVEAGGKRILLTNVGGAFYAIGGICTHEGGALDEGYLEGEAVVCPIHFARFSVLTGEVLEGPAETAEPTYPVEVRNGTVYLSTEEQG